MRKWRKDNPISAAFSKNKAKARARGIEWKITLAQFREFCELTDYAKLCGNDAESLTIDRKDNTKGYTIDNIQSLTRAANAWKQGHYDQIRMEKGYAWKSRYGI